MAKLVIGTNKTVGVPAVVKVVQITPVEPYPLLSRVKDDSNNEIGTVSGYHTDANNQKYAVVCLDAQYRLASGQIFQEIGVAVTDLTSAMDNSVWENTDTATSNCDKIIAFANAQSYTSSGLSHCRNQSFVIDGVTYYGQLPTVSELQNIYLNRTQINTKDTSASQYSSLVIPLRSPGSWSSTQANANSFWYKTSDGGVSYNIRRDYLMIIPVLEIPINE